MFSTLLNRKNKPLIHNITNYVTANDVANTELALGGAPIMADSPEESADITASADALNLNIGMLNPERLRAMLISGKAANKKRIPIVLDLVGAGASTFRKNAAMQLITELSPYIIKGNLSELNAIISGSDSRGVDVAYGENPDTEILSDFAKKTGAVIVATGSEDIITDGKRISTIKNGSKMMSRITGTGCMLSGILAVTAARCDDCFNAAIGGVVISGIAGELAEKRMTQADGTGMFRVYLIDEFSKITEREIEKNYEVK